MGCLYRVTGCLYRVTGCLYRVTGCLYRVEQINLHLRSYILRGCVMQRVGETHLMFQKIEKR
jgi:hypothetical protein